MNPIPGLPGKNLVGQPWRLAFALQEDGWYLRQDIIWHKPNPMPESCRDRCTKAHEYIFLMTKRPRYYFDQSAIREPVTGTAHARGDGVNAKIKMPDGWDTGAGAHGAIHRNGREAGQTVVRAPKDAGRHEQGMKDSTRFGRGAGWRAKQNESFSSAVKDLVDSRNKRSVWTIPTEAYSEAHFATFPSALVRPCILAGSRPGDMVLDPFGGSGTTGMVALKLGRSATLIELNPQYAALIAQRCHITPSLAI